MYRIIEIMVRKFICALLLLLVVQIPTASAEVNTRLCSLDGTLIGSFTDNALVSLDEADTPLVVEISIANDSVQYSFAAVEVGVALVDKANPDAVAFWTPVLSNGLLLPESQQTFEVQLDTTHVPPGEYVARVGVAQGNQLSALVASAVGINKSVTKATSGVDYPTTLTTTADAVSSVGDLHTYTLETENTTNNVKRDYEQHLVVSRGDMPVGSAVVSHLSMPVKMIPGSSEVTKSSVLLTTNGTYTVYGYSTEEKVLLPVTTSSFVVGDASGPTDVYIPNVGISGLADQSVDVIEVVACVALVDGEGSEIVTLEHQIVKNETVLQSTVSEVANQQQAVARVSKNDLTDFTVVTNLYNSANQTGDPDKSNEEVLLGLLEQTITQTASCTDSCQPVSVSETLEAFSAEQTVRDTLWFYLGIIAAAFLLMILILGRMSSPEEEEHEPMHEPQ